MTKEEIIFTAETLYPITTAEFKKIQEEQYELFCAKQLNYGPSNISLGTTAETDEDIHLSQVGIWFRMNDKINRLKQLLVLQKSPDLVGESIADTFQDLSNYNVISQILSRKKWGK